MPITATQLSAGDILFKHASQGFISQAIAKGQKSHYLKTMRQVGPSPDPSGRPTDITHVALALGPDRVIEFDEGGASAWQIMSQRGHGLVCGSMLLPSRKGKRYEVFSCLSHELATRAADKGQLIYELSQSGSGLTASYGVQKVLGSALFHKRGPEATLASFEAQLHAWLEHPAQTDIQFFCSEFALFCYLWAFAETHAETRTLFGTAELRLSPVELYTRIETYGRERFKFKGTLYTL